MRLCLIIPLLVVITLPLKSQHLEREISTTITYHEVFLGFYTLLDSKPYGENHVLTVNRGVYEFVYEDYLRFYTTNIHDGTTKGYSFNKIQNEEIGYTPKSFAVDNNLNTFVSVRHKNADNTFFSVMKFNEDFDSLWYKKLGNYTSNNRYDPFISFNQNEHYITSFKHKLYCLTSNGDLAWSANTSTHIKHILSSSNDTFVTIEHNSSDISIIEWAITNGSILSESVFEGISGDILKVKSNQDYIAFLLSGNTFIVFNRSTQTFVQNSYYDDTPTVINDFAITKHHIYGIGQIDVDIQDIPEANAPFLIEYNIQDNSLLLSKAFELDINSGVTSLFAGTIEAKEDNSFFITFLDDSDRWYANHYYLHLSPDGTLSELEIDAGTEGERTDIDYYQAFLSENNSLIQLYTMGGGIGHTSWSSVYMDKIIYKSTDTSIDFDDPLSDPTNFHLKQNYPNPFNPSTNISIELQQAQSIELSIYTIHGKLIKTIAQGFHNSGEHQFTIDLSEYASGVYMYQLKGNDFLETKKMTLIK